LAFAKEGARVVIAGRRSDAGAEVVHAIEQIGGQARFVRTDVAKAADVEALIKTAADTFGRLDWAFNNAGTEGTMAPMADRTEDDWDAVIDTNLKGVWLCMKYEILQMLKQGGGGCIVNNASIAGLIGMEGAAIYCASKHGVLGLTKAAAVEYSRLGIRINAVCPAAIETDLLNRFVGSAEFKARFAEMHPIRRIGTVDEVAAAVVWLCSAGASFVVGHPLLVDGGYTIQ
jgi:NAD(P)-dependent dehydrogenase (short-subunit alcohol dehydrogenase family)